MQDFISMAVKQLGVSEGQAKSATGGLLNLVQKNSSGADFSKLLGNLPGAQDLMKQATGGATGGGAGGGGGGSSGGLGGALGGLLGGGKSGGGLGSLASMASGALGKDSGAGQVASILGMLSNSGISADKAGGFVKMFTDYLSGKGGGDVVKQLLGNVPQLQQLLG
ncbi:MAG TPA: DUF2780 domain-containing protein [Phycisphaerales bacterium]|nr:DUF2780 domain-containing protein [Phycisphaerales bacterium]